MIIELNDVLQYPRYCIYSLTCGHCSDDTYPVEVPLSTLYQTQDVNLTICDLGCPTHVRSKRDHAVYDLVTCGLALSC